MNENLVEPGYRSRGLLGEIPERDIPEALSIIREISDEVAEISNRTEYIQTPHPVSGEGGEKVVTSQLMRELAKLLSQTRSLRHSL